MRVGIGYDVHKLVEGRDLIIGEVKIPYEKGLEGHSDADVLCHAIADALLGACSLPDIGVQFPDNDDKYLGMSGDKILKLTKELIEKEGAKIVNIDSTIVAQAPKMAPYISQMKNNIAVSLGLDPKEVNIKATTEEKLGFTGAGLGISAQAVCLIEF
ncbi:MAG: 2-C-methyl-D-erythritol 2,4-cyclodiphosphate synthase [Clostridiales bacterium]|nr:2-C-methyl-D-erythritol 2,4-cyclodiphosphate synthase [Clostridiales bacterium]